ncbi:GLABROUS1 enhancer-binding protein-like protein [Tanacetum coccineum]
MARSENEHTNSSSSGEEEEELESTQGSDSEPESEPKKTPQKQTLTPTLSSSNDSDSTDGETPAIAPVKEVEKPTSKNKSALPAVENKIELIEGMLNYVNEIKKDPIAEINDFYEFVKGDVHVDVTTSQMLNKVKMLRKKIYGVGDGNNNVAKSSKRINVTSKVKKSKKSGLGNGNVNMDFEVEPKMVQPVQSWHGPEQLGSMGLMVTDEGIMSKGLELLTGAKKAEMEEKSKELKDNGVSPGPSDESTEENDEDDDEAAAGPDSEFMVQEKAQNQIQKKMNPHAVNHLSFKAKSVVTLAVSNSLPRLATR